MLLISNKISNKHDIVGKIVDGLKKWKIWFSIWAVNGGQSEVLVTRKFKIDCQGFGVGYDIEISIPKVFVYN